MLFTERFKEDMSPKLLFHIDVKKGVSSRPNTLPLKRYHFDLTKT